MCIHPFGLPVGGQRRRLRRSWGRTCWVSTRIWSHRSNLNQDATHLPRANEPHHAPNVAVPAVVFLSL